MANFLASIFGTELDKVNCSFYFVRLSSLSHTHSRATSVFALRAQSRFFLLSLFTIHLNLHAIANSTSSSSRPQKIGACRHGDRCSRKHVKPSYSQTILMPNLYQNPAHDQKNRMNPSQLQNHFDAFYEDVWCELCKYGELEELVVCDNNNDRTSLLLPSLLFGDSLQS